MNVAKKKGQRYNAIGASTQMEASAESNLNYTGSTVLEIDEQTYFYERKSEALLLLMGLFKDYTATDYYNAIHDCSAQDYCDFFGIDIESEDELRTISDILYSIDAINLRNGLVPKRLRKESETSNNKIAEYVGQEYKAAIFRIVLANMMNYTINNSDFSLTDNIVLFNVIKSICVTEATSDPEALYRIIYEPDYANALIELESIYIDFLSEYYGMSKEDIRELEASEEIKRKILTLTINVSGLKYVENEQTAYVDELIARLPLLKQIILMYPVLTTEWNDFLTMHGESLSKSPQNTNGEYRLATPSFKDASSSRFKFAPSREERRHPGTTIDTEVVNTTLLQACFNSKQHERILNKTAVNKGQGKGIKYTKANPKLARFTKTPKTHKKISYHI